MADLLTRSRAMVAAEAEYNAARKALHEGADPEAKPRFVKAQRKYTEAIDAMGQVEDIARELSSKATRAPRAAMGQRPGRQRARPGVVVRQQRQERRGAPARG